MLGWCAAMCAKVSLVVPVNNFLLTVPDLSLNGIPNYASKLVGVKAAWKFCKFYFFRNFVFRGIQIGQTEPPTLSISAKAFAATFVGQEIVCKVSLFVVLAA